MTQNFKNSLWLVADKLIAMLINLVVAIYLARGLGPSGYGALAFILAAYAMVGPIANLGLNALVTRELVLRDNAPLARQQLLVNSLALRIVGATLSALALIVFAWLGPGFVELQERWALAVLALALIPYALQGLEFHFHAQTQFAIVVKMRLAVVVLAAAAKVIAVSLGLSVFAIVGIFALEYSALGLGFLLLTRLHQVQLPWRHVHWPEALKLVRRSFWLVLSGIAAIVYLKVDQLMLSAMVSHQETGVYAVAVRVSEVWYFIATAIVTAMFAQLLKLREENYSAYSEHLQRVSDGLCWAAVGLALAVSLLAPWLIRVLFGADFVAAAPILTVHIWACVFVFMRALISKWIIAEDLLPVSLISHGLGALVNIALNLWLIPEFAGLGAAYATLLSYIMASYLAFFIWPKTRPAAWIMTKSLVAPLRWLPIVFARR